MLFSGTVNFFRLKLQGGTNGSLCSAAGEMALWLGASRGDEAGMLRLEAGEKKTEDPKSGPYGFLGPGRTMLLSSLFLAEAL